MMLGCPLRSGARRDDPGMLTGSERTGWILHTTIFNHPCSPPASPNNPTLMGTLPEAVKVQVVRVKVQQGLLGIRWTLGLKDGGRGRDDSGLTRRVDGLELELGSHPQTAVGASMGDNLHLRVSREPIVSMNATVRRTTGISATVNSSRAPWGFGALLKDTLAVLRRDADTTPPLPRDHLPRHRALNPPRPSPLQDSLGFQGPHSHTHKE